MSDAAIKAALEAACRTDAFYGPDNGGPTGYDDDLRAEFAKIIAAFLRALPDFYGGDTINLAAAVELAANTGEAGDG